MEQLDKIDRKIISILSKNARISLSHLSEQVYLTPPAVSSRIEKLEKAGKIKHSEEYGKEDLKNFKYVISSANLYDEILDDVEKLDTRSKPYPAKVTERVYISSDTRKSAKLKQACEFIAKLLSCYATEENAKNCIFSVTDTKLKPNCVVENVNEVIREIINGEIYLLGE